MSVHELSHQTKSSWRTASLNELGQLYCGQSPASSTVNTNGLGTLYVSGPEQWDGHKIRQDKWTNDPKRLVPDGCIFITVKGAGVGKIFPGISCAIGRDVYAFKPKAELSAKFIEHAIRFTVQDVLRHAVGDIPGLSKAHILQHEIGLPEAQEQERIVAEIEKQFSRLDEAVANLKRVKANLKRYKASVLKAAVEGNLTKDWRKQHPNVEPASNLLERILTERRAKWGGRGKYKEPIAPDGIGFPSLPIGWTWASLGMVGQHDRPIIYGIIKPGPHIPSGVPYVRVTEMKNGWVDVKNLRRTSPERAAKFARATLAPGDVLISKDGTIGRVAVVPPELKGGNITQHVMRAPVHSLMVRDFVVWAIRSDFCQRWLTGETRGVALQGVNVEDFRRLPVPIPSYDEQEKIVAEVERRLSVIEELEAAVEANMTRADRLRQSILSQAFSGRLLTQDLKSIPNAAATFSIAAESSASYGTDSRAER